MKPSSKYDGKNLKISRKGNGYHRAQKRNLKLTSRVGQRKSWHHVWEFSYEYERIIDYDIFPPKNYWKKISNKTVRYSKETLNYNGYRKIFNLWGLV